MANIIEIEGDLVRVIAKTTAYEMALSDFLPNLETHTPVSLPLLPKNSTRAISYDASNTDDAKLNIMLEQPPRVINLDLVGTVHRLSIPFTRWYFSMSGTHGSNRWGMDDYRIFWAQRPFDSPTSKDMIPALVPNIYNESGSICFGSTGANANASIADRIDQTMNEFYATRFNHDLGIHYPNGWNGYTEWERMTVQTPNEWMKWPDWDGRYPLFSYADICGTRFDRSQQLAVVDPIPAIPLGASFGRIEEWVDALPQNHRARLLRAITAAAQREPARFEAS